MLRLVRPFVFFSLPFEGLTILDHLVKNQVTVASSALEACIGAEGIVIATEWAEFKTLDWQAIYDSMAKPAFVFGQSQSSSFPPGAVSFEIDSCFVLLPHLARSQMEG